MREIEAGTLFYVENGCWNGLVVEHNGVKEIVAGVYVEYIKGDVKTITYPHTYKNVIPYSKLFDGSLEYKIIGNARYLLDVIDEEERQAEEKLRLTKIKRNKIVDLFNIYNIPTEEKRSKEELINELVYELNRLDIECFYRSVYNPKHDNWYVISNKAAYWKELEDNDYLGKVNYLEHLYIRNKKIENYIRFCDDSVFSMSNQEWLRNKNK